MAQVDLTLGECFSSTPERLWLEVSSPKRLSRWLGADVQWLTDSHRADAEVYRGRVRQLSIGRFSGEEIITYADEPKRLVYQIARGLPLLRHHRGEVLLHPWGEHGCQLTWNIRIDSAVPGVASAIGAALRPKLRQALARLRLGLTP